MQDPGKDRCSADLVHISPFTGYYRSINLLVDQALSLGADTVTCAADDMDPDPVATAQEIGKSYLERYPDGDGVLQACGDMQGMDGSGRQASARICGSPTFGRGWIERSYEGNGPFWSGYRSFYGDEELYNVALYHGLLWMAPEYTFLHRHWSFGWSEQSSYQKRNSDTWWNEDKALFDVRIEAGFPRSGLLSKDGH
jgi:hypothetical protein